MWGRGLQIKEVMGPSDLNRETTTMAGIRDYGAGRRLGQRIHIQDQ